MFGSFWKVDDEVPVPVPNSAKPKEPIMKNETKNKPKHEPKTEPLLGSVGGRRELSWRERRALGLTFLNLLATARELKVAGEIDSSTLSSDMAAAIRVRMGPK